MVCHPPRRRAPKVAPAPAIRLDLWIGPVVYRLDPVVCDPGAAREVYRLSKGDGTHYNVARTSYGPTCDCPDFIFRRDGLDPAGCKHVKALKAAGLLAEAPEGDGRARGHRAGF